MRYLLLLFCLCFSVNLLMAQKEELAYDYIESFKEDMALVSKDGKYGFVNRSYQEVIPLVYTMALDFSDGLAAVEVSDSLDLENGTSTWVFIDKTGKQAFEAHFDYVMNSFEEGIAMVMNGGKKLLINKTGLVVMEESEHQSISYVKHQIVVVKSEKAKYGAINLQGGIIAPVAFEYVKVLTPSLLAVTENGKYGFYTSNGKRLTKPVFEEYDQLRNGFVAVKRKSKWGLLNKEGKEIVSPKYDGMDDYYEGLMQVEKNEKEGYVNEEGKVVIPIKYDLAEDFVNGKAQVELNDERFFIDKKGNVVDEDYMDIGIVTQGLSKEATEKMFLDFLNGLIKEYPYGGDGDQTTIEADSLFTIRDGVLTGSFKKQTPNGLIREKLATPVSKISDVWFDYNMGLYIDDEAAVVQSTESGGVIFSKQYKTDMFHLATPGDGYNGEQWQAKLQVALKALKRFYP